MSFVLDSSVALTWCFEDERTATTDALLDRVTDAGAVAPSLWPLEVLNGLVMAERRGRLDAQRRHRMTSLLQALPVTIDSETVRNAWQLTSHLAERFRLTVYDAAYLELAQRMNLPLASLDQELRSAGTALGVPLLGLP
jgi:predicted nucleic acid-binding protein